MKLNHKPLLIEWKISYTRAAFLQGLLAIVSFALGTVAVYHSGNVCFLIGALLMLTNWPFTFIFIMPINNVLMKIEIENVDEKVDHLQIRSLIAKWNILHAVRTILSFSAVFFYFLAFTYTF